MKNVLVIWFSSQILLLAWVLSDITGDHLCHNSMVVNNLIISRSNGWIPACWSHYKLLSKGAKSRATQLWKQKLGETGGLSQLSLIFRKAKPVDVLIAEWGEMVKEIEPSRIYISQDIFFSNGGLIEAIIEAQFLQGQILARTSIWSRAYAKFLFRIYFPNYNYNYSSEIEEEKIVKWLEEYQEYLPWGERLAFQRSLRKVNGVEFSVRYIEKLESKESSNSFDGEKQWFRQTVREHYKRKLKEKLKSESGAHVLNAKGQMLNLEKTHLYDYQVNVKVVCRWPTFNQALKRDDKLKFTFYIKYCGDSILVEGKSSKSQIRNFLKKHKELPFIMFHHSSLAILKQNEKFFRDVPLNIVDWKKILNWKSEVYDRSYSATHPLAAIEGVRLYRL